MTSTASIRTETEAIVTRGRGGRPRVAGRAHRRAQRLRGWLVIGCVAIWMVATLGPYVIMLLTSLRSERDLLSGGARLLPTEPTLDAYGQLLQDSPFLAYATNSLLTALGSVALGLLVSVTAAISLSRFQFRGRRAVLIGLLIAQLFPAVLLVIPLQSELKTMGLLDSRWGLILVYATVATPFATMLLKNFLDNLPVELDEAATIDGASSFQMARYILFPLLRPGMTAAGTYIFIFSWNEFLYALTFTSSTAAQTIPVGLQLFIGEYNIRWDLLTAGGVLAAIPVLAGFMIVQRQLIAGLTSGAVKG